MSVSPQAIGHVLEAAADAAARETLPRFRTGTGVANKQAAGFDPVTEADKGAERAIRQVIEDAFPDHGIEGEEYGSARDEAPYQWIIDPIDGTRAFISGLPVWGTLIGLYHNKVPFAGMMDQPFTGERCIALPGQRTRLKSPHQPWTAMHSRATASLDEATLMTTAPELLDGPDEQAWHAVKDAVRLTRYGCDCYAFMMLACGQVDIVIEAGLQAYDIAALIPLVSQSGGSVSRWDGGDPSRGGQVVASANPALHAKVLDMLAR